MSLITATLYRFYRDPNNDKKNIVKIPNPLLKFYNEIQTQPQTNHGKTVDTNPEG